MGFSCGIVGLPNVGKSTLFNALTATAAAQAANFPFCTIEPNVGRVAVPDARLDKLATIAHSKAVIPTQLEFVDIAGLTRGASEGKGLGNRFLANIRETTAIAHVLRCFEDDNLVHVDGSVDPVRDAEVVETELMLADLESLEKRVDAAVKKGKSGDRDARQSLSVMEPVLHMLRDGKPARGFAPSNADEACLFRMLQLLTAKPILYICNVDEDSAATGNDLSRTIAKKATSEGTEAIVLSAAVEAEIAQLTSGDEKAAFLEVLGLQRTGLARVISAGYSLLDLRTFFTVGPKEARAWTVPAGTKAPEAAAVIHSDFQRGFIRAEVITCDDLIACGGEGGAQRMGKVNVEGGEYVIADGDVVHFLFNV